ncbi:hypothetical protein B566_EDAN016076 [Ephemera danica]|nr:hypothetical protein B566_EDAN016076 [Ephemera danica]
MEYGGSTQYVCLAESKWAYFVSDVLGEDHNLRGRRQSVSASDMQASTLLLFLGAVSLQQGGQVRAATCPAPDDAPVITRLKSALFCNYDRMVRPVKQRTDNVSIRISLDLKYLSIIMLFSSTTCVLYSTGTVKCAPDLRTPVYCDQDLRRWPYDSQNCSLYLGSWAHAGEEIDVQLEDKLKRHAALYAASIVVPAFVLGALAVSSFWLRGIACRVCVCCAALIGDAIFLQYIGFHLPADGDTSPDIVAYYRDAMLLAVVALVIAMTVEGLRDQEQTVEASKQQAAPQWLAQLATWLRGSGGRAGQLLLGDTDNEQQDAEAPAPAVRDAEQAGTTPRWVTFATLLDRTAFLALTITHIIMLIALLP